MYYNLLMFKPAQPLKKSRRRVLIGIALGLLLAAAIAYTSVATHIQNSKTTQNTPVVRQTSMFSFNASEAPDWRQGPKNQTSMALFYKKADCFVSVDQKTGQVNESEQVAKVVATMQSQGNQNVTTTDKTLTLNVNGNPTMYTLHQYRSGGGTSEYYQFQEDAYINNTQGYIAVSAYCKDGADLDATTDALNAIVVKL